MRKLIVTLGILVLVGVLAFPVFANRWGRAGYGYYGSPGAGPCWLDSGDLTESQRAELDKLEQTFFDDTAKLREDVWNKSAELNNLLESANPDPKRVRGLQKEISDLRAKMAEKRINFELEARKIAPKARYGRGYGRGYGWGHHHGPYGHQRSYGYRSPHYGYGYGPCWQ